MHNFTLILFRNVHRQTLRLKFAIFHFSRNRRESTYRAHDAKIKFILFKRTLKIMKNVIFSSLIEVLEIFRLLWYSNEITHNVRLLNRGKSCTSLRLLKKSLETLDVDTDHQTERIVEVFQLPYSNGNVPRPISLFVKKYSFSDIVYSRSNFSFGLVK